MSVIREIVGGDNQTNLYIMRTDGSKRRLVPTSYAGFKLDEVSEPTWSPDGKQIAYSATGGQQTQWHTELFIINVECLLHGESCNPESRVLIKSALGYSVKSPDWSPDGFQIAYSEGGNIFITGVDEQSQAVKVSPSNIFMDKPRWSPNGTRIVGVCSYNRRITNICVMDRDGSNFFYLTNHTTDTNITSPKWSPDGRKIAFLSRFSDMPIPYYWEYFCDSPCKEYPTSVFVMNANGGDTTVLPVESDTVIQWFAWYP